MMEKSSNALRILVVEDDGPSLDLMTYLLKAFGHDVTGARDGEEALLTAGRLRPDIVVCDVHLPKVDGYEVVRRLKLNPALQTIPVIAVTALAMVGDRDRLLAAGFDGYIAKPIVPETFVSQIEAFGGQVSRAAKSSAASILAVDNVPLNISLLRSTLEPFGYRIVSAGSIAEANQVLAGALPDLILCDFCLPDGTGFDLIRSIRNDPRLRAVPFLFLSSTSRDDRLETEALALGAKRFLLRPIEPQVLLAAIEAYLPAK